jgi:hypothetical protein
MKKILFVCDVNNFPEGAFKFTASLNELEPILLTGAFFHSVNFDVLMPAALAIAPKPLLAFTFSDIDEVHRSIEKFERQYQRAGIEYRVHEESDVFKIADVIKETRFSDAVVISETLFFRHIDAEQPNSYMNSVLHASECPVMIIPENYNPVTR